ncbi:hypothetical protein A3B32_03605 [Candidatus Uhrbacteria bacterium RIFCSPLOWO2_01_FULL_53_9]|uniref:Dehydrogenase n=3 Tax=Candidatus Uhriibacteriota TaxID=1752732 RepID=A0A1F7UY36_9BACT|nr:MAG: hypothetical protein A3C17_03410 [Candidatus Uhrbacteria bacterium RIFCSPHIGHO2_02_FULL_53_13]OGL83183.1 MAG: hypothetical protein A3B32_03605 [Candidatus Uhrbacteria bacterium RIFCSPLOWO2_01_FULL_53_9]OGL89754.1 MAG: hypothetical protein A3I45_04005 [Candidatus Uhrbacteria bacterium RIFCSPLOWO2_02_FULL_53_10]
MSDGVKKLRAAVIGLGVGEQHIKGYEQHPSCEVVALCDMDEAKLKEVGTRHPGLRLETDPNTILEDPSIDVVSIATYDDVHYEQIMSALNHGKQVFAEKPLVQTREHAQDIRATLRAHPELRLSSNLILRQSPRFLSVKKLCEEGVLGELIYMEADYESGRLHKITDGWRGKIDGYSGVFGGGVHVIDLLLWITGDDVVEVSAYGNAIASRGSGFQNNDQVVSLLKFKSGLIGKVVVSLGCVSPHFHPMNVFGTKATFRNTRECGLLVTSRDEQDAHERIMAPYPGVPKGVLIPNFIDSILGRAEPLVSEDDIFRAMAVCFAIETSHREGRPVTIQRI